MGTKNRDRNVDFFNNEIYEDAICADMSCIIDRAKKLGFDTLCDYIDYLEYHNKYLKDIIHVHLVTDKIVTRKIADI